MQEIATERALELPRAMLNREVCSLKIRAAICNFDDSGERCPCRTQTGDALPQSKTCPLTNEKLRARRPQQVRNHTNQSVATQLN